MAVQSTIEIFMSRLELEAELAVNVIEVIKYNMGCSFIRDMLGSLLTTDNQSNLR